MANIVFIRHAPTKLNQEGIFMGSIDCEPDLSLYKDKIEKLIDDLSLFDFSAIYSSPLIRALYTAQEVFPKDQIVIEERLKERSFGSWEGMKKKELKMQFPEFFDENGNIDIHRTPESGEPFSDFRKRVISFLHDVNLMFKPNENIVVFTHGGVIALVREFEQERKISTSEKTFSKNVEHLMLYWINITNQEVGVKK